MSYHDDMRERATVMLQAHSMGLSNGDNYAVDAVLAFAAEVRAETIMECATVCREMEPESMYGSSSYADDWVWPKPEQYAEAIERLLTPAQTAGN